MRSDIDVEELIEGCSSRSLNPSGKERGNLRLVFVDYAYYKHRVTSLTYGKFQSGINLRNSQDPAAVPADAILSMWKQMSLTAVQPLRNKHSPKAAIEMLAKPFSTSVVDLRPRCLCINLAGMCKCWTDTQSLCGLGITLARTGPTKKVESHDTRC